MKSDIAIMAKNNFQNCVIIGATGAIGNAMTHILVNDNRVKNIHLFIRKKSSNSIASLCAISPKIHVHIHDLLDDESIQRAIHDIPDSQPIDFTFIATGILHAEQENSVIMPEKSLSEISAKTMTYVMQTNVIGPALVIKNILQKMRPKSPCIIASLSARVSSMSDNRLGGWHSYRISKAALNMLMKNTSIEWQRKNPHAIAVGLHPGTVQSDLSKPFTRGMNSSQLLAPEQSAKMLFDVVQNLSPDDSGYIFDYHGNKIEY